MSMPGLDAVGRPAVGQISIGQSAQVPIGWLVPLSEPVRERPRLPESRQQFLALHPSPVVSFGWFNELSEPVREKPRSPAALSPFQAFDPQPFVPFGWFESLSEPVRPPPRSPAALAPYESFQPAPSPFVATGWYAALSEPVRVKPGLRAHMQQAYAAPSRLIPTPTTLGVLDALETKDTFLAGAMIWNRATNTEIGVINTTPQPAEIGLSPAAPTSGQVFCKISIRVTP